MRVYVFHGGTTRAALTRDIAGSNLPRDVARWTYFNAFDVDGDASGGKGARLAATLKERGYVLIPPEGADYRAVGWLKPL